MGSDQGIYLQAASKVQTEIILRQMKTSICKLFIDTEIASGFFCKIPFGKSKTIYALFTNYHLINEEYFQSHNDINMKLNDDQAQIRIKIDNSRKKYFSKKYDIAIIVIQKKDGIKIPFLEIDENIFKKDKNSFKNLTIYNISYPKGNSAMVSYGVIKEIEDNEIRHFCFTEKGSAGSPIFNLSNNKVLGLDIGGKKDKDELFFLGYFLKKPIIEFIEEIKKKNDFSFVYDESVQAQQIMKNYDRQNSSNDQKVNTSNNYADNNNPLIRKNVSTDINFKVGDSLNDKTNNNYHKQLSFPQPSSSGVSLMSSTMKANKITMKLYIDKSQFDKKVYFISPHHDIDEFVNKSNTTIIVNGKEKKNFEKYLTANEEYYSVVLEFSSKLKYCNKMFLDCPYIIDMDLSSFETDEVVKMSYMFCNCKSLVNINLSAVNVKQVVDMSFMFYNCINLEYLDLSSFNTKSLINMHEMFLGCKKLAMIKFSPKFNTMRINDMKFIFFGCNNIKFISLDINTNEKLINEYKNKINNK